MVVVGRRDVGVVGRAKNRTYLVGAHSSTYNQDKAGRLGVHSRSYHLECVGHFCRSGHQNGMELHNRDAPNIHLFL